jgi:hypothetical protein
MMKRIPSVVLERGPDGGINRCAEHEQQRERQRNHHHPVPDIVCDVMHIRMVAAPKEPDIRENTNQPGSQGIEQALQPSEELDGTGSG